MTYDTIIPYGRARPFPLLPNISSTNRALFFSYAYPGTSHALERVETRYPNGSIKECYYIKIDSIGAPIKDSLYCEFYENGKKKMEISYRNGVEHGSVRSWFSNGALEMTCIYHKGKLDGEKSRWYQNGSLKCRTCWSLGVQDGKSETWLKSGRLRSLVSFKSGKLSGPAKWYHENGELAIVGFYGENGEREFLWQLYRGNGEKCAQISYENGAVQKKEYYATDAEIDSLFKAIENLSEK
jgi:antitoxin component YwqK of YwqJK toxin-antitoxin module